MSPHTLPPEALRRPTAARGEPESAGVAVGILVGLLLSIPLWCGIVWLLLRIL